MKTIELTQGKMAMVDDEDFEWLNQFKWHAAQRSGGLIYAQGQVDGKHQLMHRVIMTTKSGQEIDHINGDGLDNRRDNMRVCSHQQNLANSKISKTNKSGYKGVHLMKVSHNSPRPWRAQILVDGEIISLGSFSSPVEAAIAHDLAAIEFNGLFARLNFPKEVYHLYFF